MLKEAKPGETDLKGLDLGARRLKGLSQGHHAVPRPARIDEANVRHPTPHVPVPFPTDPLDRLPDLSGRDQDDGVSEVHVYAPVDVASRMAYRNPRVYMGGELRPPEYSVSVTDAGRIRAFLDAVG